MSDFSTLVTDCLDPHSLSVFGDDVEYYPRQGDEYTLTCVLDSGEEVQQGERVYLTLRAPIASFTAGEPRKDDRVTFGGVTYRVADTEKESLSLWRTLKLSVTNPL